MDDHGGAGVSETDVSALESGSGQVSTRTLDAINNALGIRPVALPRYLSTTVEVALDIRDQLRDGSPDVLRVLIQFSDDLARASFIETCVATITPPMTTGDSHFDAALAALVHRHFAGLGIDPPQWALATRAPAVFSSLGYDWDEHDRDDTDPIILEHGVILPNQTLRSS
ncbi:hypothetical protein ASE14_11925 [Agromyces sp. Root81]|uniref:hypothetical protein n=1 Tax=Agromyces sp. Root81 TaxID=1736601 RepID=UPI0006FE9F2E|nr:hypothetical protein [Agromyces sp. Root81]KRC61549.1 hypothetical protein ASE14_11925 [Agromyces sp. Root81]